MAKTASKATPGSKVKSVRWNIRIASETDEAVREAASLNSDNLSEFVQRAALSEAERVLADRTRFALDDAQWASFTELLERDPQDNPRLAKLFSKRDVFA